MDGSICPSMVARAFVLVVSYKAPLFSSPYDGLLADFHAEQYALTEASYTVVRLMQHFDCLENADPDTRLEPIKNSNLTMMHDHGVPVKLYALQ